MSTPERPIKVISWIAWLGALAMLARVAIFGFQNPSMTQTEVALEMWAWIVGVIPLAAIYVYAENQQGEER